MSPTLPPWADAIRSAYLRGEATVFIVHGNIDDLVLHQGKLVGRLDFLRDVLLAKKETVLAYDPSVGVRVLRKAHPVLHLEEADGQRSADVALPAIERVLRGGDGVAVVMDYADLVAPRGEVGFMADADRRAVATLHRWSLDPGLEASDNVVLLFAENLTDLSPRLVSNPRAATVEIPLPDVAERAAVIRLLEPDATPREVERLAQRAGGLQILQIRALLDPGEDTDADYAERYELARRAFEGAPDVAKRARNLARQFSGQPLDRLRAYLEAHGHPARETTDRYDEVIELLGARKRAILERECFGLIEFVEPDHDFSAVGGFEDVKRELMQIARNIREGNTNRVPMGLLFVGPMGTGKTFVAEAFAKSSGLTAIKLKNFRSRWVGATEGNLEKILSVVQAIGNVLVILDEGDRAFGSGSESDGGTTSRVIARIKEFMSDTTNRGRVLFVVMTNRPDKLDIDIKRAGRLDRKIPFFYAQTAEDVEPVLLAQLRRLLGVSSPLQLWDPVVFGGFDGRGAARARTWGTSRRRRRCALRAVVALSGSSAPGRCVRLLCALDRAGALPASPEP
jgi:transitional endoplasmic reticulum ATPase